MTSPFRPARRAVAATAVSALALTLAAAALGSTALTHARAATATGPLTAGTLESVVSAGVLATGAAVAAWWAASLALVAVIQVGARSGRERTTLVRVVRALGPQVLRRVAVVGLGAGLSLGALPAVAADEPPDLGWVPTASTGSLLDETVETVETLDSADAATTAQTPETVAPTATAPTGTVPDASPALPALPVLPVLPSPGPGPVADVAATAAVGSDLGPGRPEAPAHARTADEHEVVVVHRGDSLWSLSSARLPHDATDAEVASAWRDLYAVNRDVVGDDPDLLYPGQVLVVPRASAPDG